MMHHLSLRPPSLLARGGGGRRQQKHHRNHPLTTLKQQQHRRLLASSATTKGSGDTAAAATTTTTAAAAAPPRAPPSTCSTSWEDLYIIPSSFDDDDDDDDVQVVGSSLSSVEDNKKDSRRPRQRVLAWPNAGPIVILPGFGNDTQDYEAPFGDARKGLAPRLRRRGFVVETVRLRRRDWLRVAKGILSPSYWRGQADTGPGYFWYLLRVAAAVRRAEKRWVEEQRQQQGEWEEEEKKISPPPRVTLVAHSAGGWLARSFLGDAALRSDDVAAAAQAEEDRAMRAFDRATEMGGVREALATVVETLFSGGGASSSSAPSLPTKPQPCTLPSPHPSVGALVTLGTPHLPPAAGSGARDVTGGALGWVNERWPGAFFGGGKGGKGGEGEDNNRVIYVTVAGRAVVGAPAEGAASSDAAANDDGDDKDNADQRAPPPPPPPPPPPRGSAPSYAREAYRAVAGGQGVGVVGDAVVPLAVAGSLQGADAAVVLDGVWHSMSRLGSFKEAPPNGGEGGGGVGRGGSSGGGVRPWYGSGGAIDVWLGALKEAEEKRRRAEE
jgi:hypothetical protein